MSNTTPVSNTPRRRCGPAALPGRAAHGEPYTRPEGVCRGVRSDPSGHAAGPELDAHPGPDGLGRLRDAVLPGALTGATHHDQVAMPQGEPQALAAADRAEH